MTVSDTPVMLFPDRKAWLAWLEKNHDSAPAVFAKIAKKGANAVTATYEELREGALMYGWIDGITYSVDAQFYMVRFTPRRPKGKWSKVNRALVEELLKAGKMKPSGIAQVDAAKADGRWDAAYDGQANIEVPEDFQAELNKHPNCPNPCITCKAHPKSRRDAERGHRVSSRSLVCRTVMIVL